MNPHTHARISAQNRGGRWQDYYPIHSLMDSTKELCSDNRHRILHTLWGVRRVVVPIFGPAITNSDGMQVNVKDICEQDHILPDYGRRFIPTLHDFVNAIEADGVPGWREQINRFHEQWAQTPEQAELLLSPLALTGRFKSLLITHNSWFLNAMMPRLLGTRPLLADFELSPALLFENMRFELWMDNGAADPPSARMLQKNRFPEALK